MSQKPPYLRTSNLLRWSVRLLGISLAVIIILGSIGLLIDRTLSLETIALIVGVVTLFCAGGFYQQIYRYKKLVRNGNPDRRKFDG